MRFPSFHLSTLVLLCVFVGAAVGLWLRGDVWLLVKSSYVHPASGIAYEPGYPWLTKTDWVYAAISRIDTPQTRFDEMAIYEPEAKRIAFYQNEFGSLLLATLPVDDSFISLKYSPDGNHFSVWLSERVDIYRRSRAYGLRGLIELPLFWLAAASFVALGIIFARRMVRNRREPVKLKARLSATVS